MEVVKLDPNEKRRDDVQMALEAMCKRDIVKLLAVTIDVDGEPQFHRASMSDVDMLWYAKQIELKALEDE